MKLTYESLLAKQKVLVGLNHEYKIKVVNGNYELISKLFKQKTYSKGTYTPKELGFIKSVKNHILRNEIHLKSEFQEQQYFAEDIHYIRVAKVPLGEVFDNVVEVDIDQAYFETAYQLGIIDDNLYNKGKKGSIRKIARLTALGSLAKKTYVYNFKGKKLKSREIETDVLLQNLWFTICKRVSDVMNEVIIDLGNDFIFYWVDGIYFKNTKTNLSKVMAKFIEAGYNSKFRKINQIYFHEKGFAVNDYGDIVREFNYPAYIDGKKVNYSENFRLNKLAKEVISGKIDLVDKIKNGK